MNRYMNMTRWPTRLAALLLVLAAAQGATIDIALTAPLISGTPGTALTFNGILINTTASTVFLNAAGINLAGFTPASENTNPFFANAPLSLAALGSTSSIDLFTINIPDPFAAGSYQGTFTVLGGADGNAQSTIGSAPFTVEVQNGPTVPEPSSATFLILGVAAMVSRRFLVRYSIL